MTWIWTLDSRTSASVAVDELAGEVFYGIRSGEGGTALK